MTSAAIIGIPPRKRVMGGGEGVRSNKEAGGGFSSIQSIIRISHNHANTCIVLLNFSFTLVGESYFIYGYNALVTETYSKSFRSISRNFAVTYRREVIVASKCPSSHVVSHCNECAGYSPVMTTS